MRACGPALAHPLPPATSHRSLKSSIAAGAWEAVWNGEGRCSGLNISQYFTFLAASYNLFNANVSRPPALLLPWLCFSCWR